MSKQQDSCDSRPHRQHFSAPVSAADLRGVAGTSATGPAPTIHPGNAAGSPGPRFHGRPQRTHFLEAHLRPLGSELLGPERVQPVGTRPVARSLRREHLLHIIQCSERLIGQGHSQGSDPTPALVPTSQQLWGGSDPTQGPTQALSSSCCSPCTGISAHTCTHMQTCIHICTPQSKPAIALSVPLGNTF